MATTTAPTTSTTDPTTAALQKALQGVVDAANADLALTTLTSGEVLAAMEARAYAQSALVLLSAQTAGPPQAAYSVTPYDLLAGGLFGIAARQLGDGTRFSDIQALNGMRGIALVAGQQLTLPQD